MTSGGGLHCLHRSHCPNAVFLVKLSKQICGDGESQSNLDRFHLFFSL